LVDNNGNTQSKTDSTGTTGYAWDFENRLASVTLPGAGGTVSFKYDPFGRRIYKSSSTGTSVFSYDREDITEEVNLAGSVVARYVQGISIDEPLAMLRSGATSYYHADGLGSVTSLSNSAGSLANTYTYDSFGKLTASTGSLTNSFRYTAREFDTEINLYFYRARYYDQSSGRFATEDPFGFVGSINFFSYANNNPTNRVDPYGLLSLCCRQVKSTAFILCHCFLVLNDNKTTMGGYKFGSHLVPLVNGRDDSPVPNSLLKRSLCDKVPAPSCIDARLNAAFNDLLNDEPPGGYKYFKDGTSNTVPAELLRRAGVDYKFPWCAWGSGKQLGGPAPTIDPRYPNIEPPM